MSNIERISPFYCGSQRADWDCYNCGTCKLGYHLRPDVKALGGGE
jgi:hypothetical protein